jgi:hypothetical protein
VIVNKLVYGGFEDYNISANRTYEYIFYPFLEAESQEGKVGWGYKKVVSTSWDFWSLTELHPTEINSIVIDLIEETSKLSTKTKDET